MRRIEKPWGYELIWAETDHYVGKILHVWAGEALSLQYHEVKDETIMVLSGLVEIGLGEAPYTICAPYFPVRITPGTRHRIRAIKESDIVEVSTPELDDVVRLMDDYGRADGKPQT